MQIPLKKTLQALGYVLTITSFVYIYHIIANSNISLPNKPITQLIFIGLAFSFANALFPFLSTIFWKLLVEFVGTKKMPFSQACSIYIKSNIAKYLPGNVMQYVGRNYIGKKYGWSNRQLLISSVLEVVCIIGIPTIILIVFYSTSLWQLPPKYSLQFNRTFFLVLGVLFSSLIIAIVLLRFYKHELFETLRNKVLFYREILVSFATWLLLFKIAIISLISFFLNGLLFYLLANYLDINLKISDFINITCALTIAGYSAILTPGVPGGIGIKESISIVFLTAYGYPNVALATLMVTSRLFSVLGDLIAFLLVSGYNSLNKTSDEFNII